MSGQGAGAGAGFTRRAALLGVLALAMGSGVEAAIAIASAVRTPRAPAPAAMVRARTAPLPPLSDARPTPGVVFQPASGASMQCFTSEPWTGEWYITQATPGRSRFVDSAGLPVGDIVVSRLARDGRLLDSMTLPDSGHGMGLVVRLEAGIHVLYTCWFAPGLTGTFYDVVRLPYAPGVAERAAATTVVKGAGYPVDPSYDASTSAVTLRHQGGGGPEYTRHRWSDFAAGDLSRPTGRIPTPDWPPTHQGFCSVGDRFFFSTGAPSTEVGGDSPLITEYDWRSGAIVGRPLDTSGNSRLPNGEYPGGSMEPEGAAIVADGPGIALVVGVTNGAERGRKKVDRTFWYPLASSRR